MDHVNEPGKENGPNVNTSKRANHETVATCRNLKYRRKSTTESCNISKSFNNIIEK